MRRLAHQADHLADCSRSSATSLLQDLELASSPHHSDMSAPASTPKAAIPVAQPIARPVAVAQPVAQPVAKPVAQQQPRQDKSGAGAGATATSSSSSSGEHAVAPRVALPVASPTHDRNASSSSSSSGSGEFVDARMILDMPGTRAYKLVDGTKKLVENGKLELMSSSVEGSDEVFLVHLGHLKLALNIHIPCLEMAPRNFVFPSDEGTYGIVVAEAITEDVLDVFREILTEHTSFRTAAEAQTISALPDRPEKITSAAQKVAGGLGAGSVVVATGVVKGGLIVGDLIKRGGLYLTTKLKPNEKATVVSQESKARLAKAKFVSGAACKVSKALVVGAIATTEIMAKQLSEAIKQTETGKKIANDSDHPSANVEAAKVVGKATIGAVLNVYQAIETAVFGVAADAATATVTVVTHKYGQEAGSHTKESFGVAGNVAEAGLAMKSIGVKSIAKKVAIKASQDVLTTPAERAAEEEKRRLEHEQKSPAQQARHGIGEALGLPAGMDPLVAIQAVSAMASLNAAAIEEQRHAKPGEVVVVTTASASGPNQAAAQKAAREAAQAVAHQQ